MFCEKCGTAAADGARFCRECGAALTPSAAPAPASGYLIGFSPRINDPSFAAYKRKSATWSLLFAGILAVVMIVGFPIYGNRSGDVEWPQTLYYGLALGGMFLLIAIVQTLKRRFDQTWDGVVESKDTFTETERSRDGRERTIRTPVYVIKVRKDSGGLKKHKWRGSPGLYHYYNVGDRVRHHKGFQYYEKYDKSQDKQIMCAACLSFNDIHDDRCKRCKCPLLK
jgi:uncharacterized integral membrane protein